MTDRLALYRGALRLLGDGRLHSLTEDSPRRKALDDIWTDAVNLLLSQGLWNWGIRTVELVRDDNIEPYFGYPHAFSQPEDYVRLVGFSDSPDFFSSYEQFQNEAGYWYAYVNPLYIRYISSSTLFGWNIGEWTPMFTKALEAYLAFESGLPISNDKVTRDDMFKLYQKRLRDAKSLDAVNDAVAKSPPGRLVSSRTRSTTDRY